MFNLKSDFAILDVKTGRKKLSKFIKKNATSDHPDTLLHEKRIPVTITGYIAAQWGGDDGTSIEFALDVESVKTDKPGENL